MPFDAQVLAQSSAACGSAIQATRRAGYVIAATPVTITLCCLRASSARRASRLATFHLPTGAIAWRAHPPTNKTRALVVRKRSDGLDSQSYY
eukprot:5630667-Pleurochrysis_carterae.AAC.2